jgi:dolichyl-phosphate beta-glucosyltransferase
LSVIIPMYNEEFRIKNTLHDLCLYLDSNESKCFKCYEIILIDDGSKDNTLLIVDKIKQDLSHLNIKVLKHDKNKGKGGAVKTGVYNSKGDYIIYIDSDNAVSMFELNLLILYINDFDIIIGSRKLNKYIHSLDIKRNIRRLISTIGYLLNKTLIKSIHDTQCPFKLLPSDLAKNIFKKMVIDRYAFDLELLFLAQKNGYSVKEVSINYKSQPGSQFRIFKDVYKSLVDFIKIHHNYFSGKYR